MELDCQQGIQGVGRTPKEENGAVKLPLNTHTHFVAILAHAFMSESSRIKRFVGVAAVRN